MSMPLGEHDVCRHLEVKQEPEGYRRLGTVPLAVRVNIRHHLEGIRHQVGDLRNAMAHEELNADGAITDIQHMINGLQAIKRQLS